MSHAKIWIHAVWSTKNRSKTLTHEVRHRVCKHILENARSKRIYIDFINGWYDHLHALLTLNAELSISKVMQLLKGESSHWANKVGIVKSKLEWSDEYFAASVSEAHVPKVRNYIRNQQRHHATRTFDDEYNEFLRMHDLVP